MSHVMEPWEVINSYGNGPYAIRTLLGWVVNGLSEKSSDCRNDTGSAFVTVKRISIGRLEDLLQHPYIYNFKENMVDKTEISRLWE